MSEIKTADSRPMKIFAQLTKVDMAKHEVWGIATAEVVDKEGEIFDYNSSKPFFEEWSDEISKATGGKSLGNVREMHEPSAVGKLVNITFNDDLKQIEIGSKIVDDTAWGKCVEGVYTGFSIGGKYEDAWKDGDFVRFTAKPFEISVVDNPAVPTAHFTAIKADGSCEIRKFAQKPEAEKAGAKHSAETQAHHEAIAGAVAKCMKLMGAAQEHCDALMGKSMKDAASLSPTKLCDVSLEQAVVAGFMTFEKADKEGIIGFRIYDGEPMTISALRLNQKVSAEPEPTIKKQESNIMDEKDKLQLEKAHADSASALSKVAAVEQSVNALKAEIEARNTELQKTLKGFMDILEKMNAGTQKVARTVTFQKEDDTPNPKDKEKAATPHDAMKAALANPQPAFDVLRQPATAL